MFGEGAGLVIGAIVVVTLVALRVWVRWFSRQPPDPHPEPLQADEAKRLTRGASKRVKW